MRLKTITTQLIISGSHLMLCLLEFIFLWKQKWTPNCAKDKTVSNKEQSSIPRGTSSLSAPENSAEQAVWDRGARCGGREGNMMLSQNRWVFWVISRRGMQRTNSLMECCSSYMSKFMRKKVIKISVGGKTKEAHLK